MCGICNVWGAFGSLIDWLGSEEAGALEGFRSVGVTRGVFSLAFDVQYSAYARTHIPYSA